MLLKDVVEEISEKSPNFLSPASIVRKVTQVRDRLIRLYGSAQQQVEAVCTGIDLKKDQAQYILPCPPSSVTDVTVLINDRYKRLVYRQYHNDSIKPYYYFQAGKIGFVPTPDKDVTMGIKIFHTPVLAELTINDFESPTGFDPDYDMLLVYGVLREIAQGYEETYQTLLMEYKTASNGFEKYSVDERW
jgi:hypothetical protein